MPGLLLSLTSVKHDMDSFPWYLSGRLIEILESPEASFEYLQLTMFFRARAAMLALQGNVLDHAGLHTALSKNQVQIGGIYLRHLLRAIRNFLAKHNLAQLPDCEIHNIDPFHGPKQVEKNRELLQCLIHTADFDFLSTLNFLSLSPDSSETIFNYSVGYWGDGAEMPVRWDVPAIVTTHGAGYDIRPCLDASKRMSCARIPLQKIEVRNQAEFPFEIDEIRQTEPANRKELTVSSEKIPAAIRDEKPAHAIGTTADMAGRPQVTVIGDFRAIVLPNERKAIPLVKKYKTRTLLRFIQKRVAENGSTDFYVEEIREIYNAQLSERQATRRWRSDRIREDLFGKIKRVFDLLFETLDKGAGHYRLRVSFITPEVARERG